MTDDEILDLLHTLGGEILAKAVAAASTRVESATVLQIIDNVTARVIPDSNAATGNWVEANNAAQSSLKPGARVLVLFYPPHGAVIFGPVIANDPVPGNGGVWSKWIAWTPRMAGLDYTNLAWVEPDYGDATDADTPAKQIGYYRTNGVEVHARALVLFGPGANSVYNIINNVDTDYVIYLSLPLPSDEQFPPLVADNNPLPGTPWNDYLFNYSLGFSPLAPDLGSATWAARGGAAGYGAGELILPPWSQAVNNLSFPDGVPPADIDEWVSAITTDTSTVGDGGNGPGISIWSWSTGPDIQGPSPAAQGGDASISLDAGVAVAWTAHYMRKT